VDTDLQPLGPDTPLPSVTSYLATYNMVAAPVVDESGALLGAVTVDDVLDHLLPEDWRETDYRPPGADDGPDAGRDGGYGADDSDRDGSGEGDDGRPGRDEEQRVTEAADGR
jgi:CBS domain-containing protein